MMHVQSFRACLAAALVAAFSAPAEADPLPKEACQALGVEHAKLAEAGLPELVKKGPAWVKANHGDARMLEVARYIRLHEDLLFRCGYDKAKALPGADGDEAQDERIASVAIPPLPQRKPPVPESFKARPIPAANTGTGATAPARPQPKSQSRTKRNLKVDDAYRPPPKAVAPQ